MNYMMLWPTKVGLDTMHRLRKPSSHHGDPGYLLLPDVRWVRNDPLWRLMGEKVRGVTEKDTASLEKLVRYYVSAHRE